MEERIFALDIGTRSVTGILLAKTNETYSVIDYCIKEHSKRSMLDGQIHDIPEVSRVIRDVKKELEAKHGALNRVCVAAAGRSLITVQGSASIPLNQEPITDDEIIKHLELSAVQDAQRNLVSDKHSRFYCAGYSVLQYKLDEQPIGSLIEQIGDEATVEIIATFLPKVVIESLLAALDRADLAMEALTLEPIAAIHVLIPESMRRLNVALVDIGAGTSDIAITDRGTIAAYGMVPLAGDEITEAVSDHYLLDFPTAEKTKREIVNNGQTTVYDILGMETTITYDQLTQDIGERIEHLAGAIAEEIVKLNNKAPKAAMLIGGGSLSPGIANALAKKLQLPTNRVAVRGMDAIQNLQKTDMLPAGPDFITPIGIAIAAKKQPIHYVTVSVNNKIIRMFEMRELTVGDSLVQAGIDIKKMYGKPGMAAIVTFNGKNITLPGEFGSAPVIYLNGETTSVDQVIETGDQITIQKGRDGQSAQITLEQLIDDAPPLTIYFNGKKETVKPIVRVNGNKKPLDYVVQDKDVIDLQQPQTVQDVIELSEDVPAEIAANSAPFTITVNKRTIALDKAQPTVYVNGKRADLTTMLKQNDELNIIPARQPTVADLLEQLKQSFYDRIHVTFNGKPVTIKQKKLTIQKNGREVTEDAVLEDRDVLTLEEHRTSTFIFQDVFRYVDLDLTDVKGNFRLYKNGQPTTFYETIANGDNLELKWM